MNFEDLQKTWQQDAMATKPVVDATLLAEVRKGSRAFSRRIFWRDVREVAASFLVAAIFGKMAIDAETEGAPAWPLWIAAGLPLGVAAFFIIDRVLMHRRASPQGETVAAEVERAAAAVRHQIWLLRNVLWWYILPLAVATTMIGVQFILYAPETMPAVVRWIMGALVLLTTGWFDLWVWRLNQKAVRDDLLPRLAELEQRRDELLNDNSNDE